MLTIALLAFLSMPAVAAEAAVAGVPNFHQVNEHIYRSGQPAAGSWAVLAGMGVSTVIDLRHPGGRSKKEAQEVEAAGMYYINVPLSALSAPHDAPIAKLLAILDAEPGGAVLVHCERGADRAGTVIACYRIAHDHWSNRKALEEAVTHGMSPFEFGMRRYILDFAPH